jgi:hypothetical protein
MAVTLAEAREASSDTLQAGVIQTFIDESPVLSRLPFMTISGNAYQYARESRLPGVAFRAVNGGYTESTGAIVNAVEGLKIFGGDADVDRFIVRTMSNRMDQEALQTRLKAKAAAINFTSLFFEGDSRVDPLSFDGMRVRITGSQVINAGTGGATLDLDMLDELIDAVIGGPSVIYANDFLIRKINALVRASGGANLETLQEYGRKWYSYAGVLLTSPKLDADEAEILGFDEDDGSGNSDTASIYAIRFGAQEYVSGLQNGGIDVYPLGELETKPAFRTRIEWYVGLAQFNGKAAARLAHVNKA